MCLVCMIGIYGSYQPDGSYVSLFRFLLLLLCVGSVLYVVLYMALSPVTVYADDRCSTLHLDFVNQYATNCTINASRQQHCIDVCKRQVTIHIIAETTCVTLVCAALLLYVANSAANVASILSNSQGVDDVLLEDEQDKDDQDGDSDENDRHQ
jgi:hypothetical protein